MVDEMVNKMVDEMVNEMVIGKNGGIKKKFDNFFIVIFKLIIF